MPSIGPLEILMVAVIALIVFGPEKLPDMARTVARTIGEMRRMASDIQAEFKEGLEVEDEKEAPNLNGQAPKHPVEQALAADKELTKNADEKLTPVDDGPVAREISNKPEAGAVGPGTAATRPDES